MISSDEKSRAVFVDRDGTIMHDADYCSDPKQVHVFEGVRKALCRLKRKGYKLIIITNQSGIGRGFFTIEQYRAVETELWCQLGPGLI
ncbi:MAG: HAD family hydrolase, partial [Verrucomicrobia bacterium]